MYALIKPFVRLCLLNANPQDLPASTLLLALCLAGYLTITTLIALPVYGFGVSLVQGFIEILLLLAYTQLVLQVRARPERYLQTVTSLAGTGVIIGVLGMPLIYSLYRSAQAGSVSSLTLLSYLLVLGWLLVVYGHIFRQALSIGRPFGVLIGFGYIVLTSIVIESLFPSMPY
ncbi:MAG: hypothetical protein ACR2KU_01185 [Gammaproteobacteria bacterium]|nr:hypothetical protein [Gammaproteobacteria bacterium]